MGQRDEDAGLPPHTIRHTDRDLLVAPLDSFGMSDIGRAGGKGAHLGALVRSGYRVPDGFVVTTDAYAAAVRALPLSSQFSTLDDRTSPQEALQTAGSAIRSAILEAPFPEALRALVLEAHADLGSGPVAVRSSSTAEDLPGAAFAGQHDTFLNVIGQAEVVDAVRRCWASLWTDRAISYRRRLGLRSADVRIAVVVQRLVEAEVAGVMLTANPVTGARDEIVVDASTGLGEAVVSGMVTPDHYRLDREGRVLECLMGDRRVVIRGTPGGGVVHDMASGVRPTRLADPVLVELALVGEGVAALFGRPQDIEWALAEEEAWVIQARALTALPPPPLALSRVQRRIGPQLLEMLPIRPYPLDMSMWIQPGLGRMVERMLDEMLGVRVDFARVLPEVDGVVDRFVPPTPRPTLKVLTALYRDVRRIRRNAAEDWTRDGRFADFDRRIRQLDGEDLTALGWAEVATRARRALDAVDTITDLRIDYLPRAGASVVRLRLVLKLLRRTELYSALVQGTRTRTQDANRALEELAARVRADDRLVSAFASLDAEALDSHLRRPEFAHFRRALEEFLGEYGHRETSSALLISAPTWSDSPPTVLGAIEALVEEPSRESPGQGQRQEVMERLLRHPVLRRARPRSWAVRAVESARAGIALREDTHFHATRALPVLRRAALELGRRLAEAGALDRPEDVFHARFEELEQLPGPREAPTATRAQLRETVRTRAGRRAELDGAPLISTATLFPGRAGQGDALVRGTPAGGGRATGPVRVVHEPAEFGRLRAGEVLVCPYTNPSWTSLFQRAAAVVVDTGGSASHAAIVARECGIPAVMGTGTGTTTLRDGRMVTVDGDRGVVLAHHGDDETRS